MPAVNIIDAFEDPELFAPCFPGPSWVAWRTILKAAFCIPLDDSVLDTFHALAGDRAPPERQVRELWIIAGRRAGKDSIASAIAARVAAFFGNADRLRPGERALALNLATDRDQAKICLNYVRAFFTSIPMLNSMVVRVRMRVHGRASASAERTKTAPVLDAGCWAPASASLGVLIS